MNTRKNFLQAIEDAELQASFDDRESERLASKDLMSQLKLTNQGHVSSSQWNYSLILANDENLEGCFRLDTYRHQITMQGALPFGSYEEPVDFDEVKLTKLLGYLGSRYGIEHDKKTMRAIKEAAESNCYDSLIDRLDGLAWDGVPRIETMLSVLLGVEDNDYTQEAAKLLMRGAVCRAYSVNGVQFDVTFVLVGPQGCRKTSFCRRLALEHEYYEDNLGDLRSPEAVRKLQGTLVVEMAELASLRMTKKKESIRSFLTSTHDTHRPLYTEDKLKLARRCVFIGTTNDYSFLDDAYWERRFLPVECGIHETRFDWTDDKNVQYFFEQIWAEAVSWYKEDTEGIVKTLTPSKELLEANIKQQERFRSEDPWYGPIVEYLEVNRKQEICAKELLVKVLNCDVSDEKTFRKSARKIHELMRAQFPDWILIEETKRLGEWGPQSRYYIYQPRQ